MESTGMLHSLFRAGIGLLSICRLHTSFGGRNQGDSFGSGGRGVRETSTSGIAFVLILSSSKGTEALLFSFLIAPTLIPTAMEHHSREIPE